MRTTFSNKNFLTLVKGTALWGMALLAVGPLVWMVLISFSPTSNVRWQGGSFSIRNYIFVITNAPIVRNSLNSIFISAFSIAGTLLSGLFAAYGFSRIEWRCRNALFSLLIFGMILPEFTTIIPTFLLWNRLGLSSGYLPLIVPSWFGSSIFTVYVLRQFFLGIPCELDESAKIDGATHITILFKVLAPMAQPALIVSTILCFITTWNEFLQPLIYINDPDLYTLTLSIQYFNSGVLAQWNRLSAACVLGVLPSMIIFVLFHRHISKGAELLYN